MQKFSRVILFLHLVLAFNPQFYLLVFFDNFFSNVDSKGTITNCMPTTFQVEWWEVGKLSEREIALTPSFNSIMSINSSDGRLDIAKYRRIEIFHPMRG